MVYFCTMCHGGGSVAISNEYIVLFEIACQMILPLFQHTRMNT